MSKAIGTYFKEASTPRVKHSSVFFNFLVSDHGFTINRDFHEGHMISTKYTKTVQTTKQWTSVGGMKSTTRHILGGLVPLPLVFNRFFPCSSLRTAIFRLHIRSFMFVKRLHKRESTHQTSSPGNSMPCLRLRPYYRLVLLFRSFLRLALCLQPNVTIVRNHRGQNRLPQIIFGKIGIVLVLIMSKIILQHTLSFFIRLFFRFLVILLYTPSIPILNNMSNLPKGVHDTKGRGETK